MNRHASARYHLAVLCLAASLAFATLPGCSHTSSSPEASGPAADVSEELTAGGGPFIGESTPPRLDQDGYVQHEYVAAGTAVSYRATEPLTGDGRWSFAEDGSAPYRTRILVRRPADPRQFSGTVVLEWLNVSGGLDGNPDWTSLAAEITRRGHAWVGVSAQLIGVSGGPVLVVAPGAEGIAGKGLTGLNPARYSSLRHPGDGYSFDIYTQVARALRGDGDVLGGVAATRIIAAGESQSAIALTTYYDGVQPLTGAFDGFLVHSRASVGLPLVGPGEYADLARGFASVNTILRDDVDVPALEIQTEGDLTSVLNSVVVRQPDTDTFRLWEVAGTSHADRFLLGPLADTTDCGAPVNEAPMHVVVKAAFRQLEEWIRTGEAPPEAPRIETAGEPATIVRDADGIALGGIRTPPVDVPSEILSGIPGPNPDLLCILLGSTEPLSAARLAELYSGPADYLQRYDAAADAAIGAGFVLEEDRATLRAYAQPERIAG
jgi:hypothetical protein